MIHLGYFLEDFVNHLFFKEERSDHWEMVLHHSVTLTLYWGMIMQNFIRVGIVISWLHSVSDITTAITRIFFETKFTNLAVYCFLACIGQWIIMRNIWMPMITYNTINSVYYPAELADY